MRQEENDEDTTRPLPSTRQSTGAAGAQGRRSRSVYPCAEAAPVLRGIIAGARRDDNEGAVAPRKGRGRARRTQSPAKNRSLCQSQKAKYEAG